LNKLFHDDEFPHIGHESLSDHSNEHSESYQLDERGVLLPKDTFIKNKHDENSVTTINSSHEDFISETKPKSLFSSVVKSAQSSNAIRDLSPILNEHLTMSPDLYVRFAEDDKMINVATNTSGATGLSIPSAVRHQSTSMQDLPPHQNGLPSPLPAVTGRPNGLRHSTDADGFSKVLPRRRNQTIGRSTVGTLQGAGTRTADYFVTRLNPETSVEQLITHLRSVCGAHGVSVEKLPTRFSSYSSFKVTISRSFNSAMFDSDNWPENVLVRKYFAQRN
jgi:hypothetical protein